MDEVARWKNLAEDKKVVFTTLLQEITEFEGFLHFVNAKATKIDSLADLIRSTYQGKICEHADIENIIAKYPCELAYALALIDTTDRRSVTPA